MLKCPKCNAENDVSNLFCRSCQHYFPRRERLAAQAQQAAPQPPIESSEPPVAPPAPPASPPAPIEKHDISLNGNGAVLNPDEGPDPFIDPITGEVEYHEPEIQLPQNEPDLIPPDAGQPVEVAQPIETEPTVETQPAVETAPEPPRPQASPQPVITANESRSGKLILTLVLVLVAAAAALLFYFAGTMGSSQGQATRLYNAADKAFSAGDYPEALKNYQAFLDEYPEDPLVAVVKMRIDAVQKELQAASPAGTPGESDSEIEALLVKARSAFAASRLVTPDGDNVMEYVQDIFLLDPGHPEAVRIQSRMVAQFESRARTALARKDYRQAKQHYRHLLQILPQDANVLQQLAQIDALEAAGR